MPAISPCVLPGSALLNRYAVDADGYTDCYCTDVALRISLAKFVFAFYTSPAFRPERLILTHLARMPSSHGDARELAAGTTDRFAAWRVEARTDDQLLLSDFRDRTRSWLMAAPSGETSTRLYFGSAVIPIANANTGSRSPGPVFHALLGFHKVYSRVLLAAAARRLE